jgi:hypothetical protein
MMSTTRFNKTTGPTAESGIYSAIYPIRCYEGVLGGVYDFYHSFADISACGGRLQVSHNRRIRQLRPDELNPRECGSQDRQGRRSLPELALVGSPRGQRFIIYAGGERLRVSSSF